MDLQNIADEILIINQYCQNTYDQDDGNVLHERLTKLNSFLARSGFLLSKAGLLKDHARGKASEDLLKEMKDTGITLSPTQSKEIINGRTANECSVYQLCERTNRTITHLIDSVRTQLSYIKSQM